MSGGLDISVTRQANAVLMSLADNLDCRGETALLSAWSEASGPSARSLWLDVSGLN